MIVTTASANKPLVFKPSRSLFTKENPSTDNPLAVQGGKLDAFQIEMEILEFK